jgi:hypothetical protein
LGIGGDLDVSIPATPEFAPRLKCAHPVIIN